MCYFLFLFTNPIYYYSDNWMVSVVTSGYYGNNQCQYIHPLLCIIVKALSDILPKADAFTLLMHVAIFLSLMSISFLSLNNFLSIPRGKRSLRDYTLLIIEILALFYVSNELRIWNTNYNIQTAAVLSSGIIITFIAYYENRSNIWIICGTLLTTYGVMLRKEVAYLFFPYIILTSIVTYLDEEREKKKSLLKCILPGLIIITVLILLSNILYLYEPYRVSAEYNRYRTLVVDYPMKGWDQLENPVFSMSDYKAATEWFFGDTEKMSVQILKKIADAGSKNEYSWFDIDLIVRAMWSTVARIDIYTFLMFLISIIIATKNIFFGTSRWTRVDTILALAGSATILYFFTARGRAPLRVWQPVLFAQNAVLIVSAFRERKKTRKLLHRRSDFTMLTSLFIIMWFGAGQFIAHAELRKPQSILTARADVNDTIYEKTYVGDNIYLWDNWHAGISIYFMKIGKLPTQRVIDHNLSTGDWTYGQVYYNDYLTRIGLSNPAKGLVYRDHTYLINGSDTVIIDYLRDHYGDDLEMAEVDWKIDNKAVYQIVTK